MLNRAQRLDSRAWFALLVVAAAFSVNTYLFPLLPLTSLLKVYTFPSLIWTAVGIIIVSFGSYRPVARMSLRPSIVMMSLAAGIFQIILYAIGGLFSGFGMSSNSFAPISVAGNVVLVAGTLWGTEISRAWLVNHMGRRVLVNIIAVTVLFTFVSIPPGQIFSLRANASAIDFVNSTLLPTLASGLLASFLAMLAGPRASIIYVGLLQAFWWFLPVLPDLSWAFKGIIGTAVPILALAAIRSYYVSKTERRRAVVRNEDSAVGWVAIAVFCVVLIWFAVGIFPIRPSLIASGSMSPVLKVGDITIVVKVPTEQIKVGDVIQFKLAKGVYVIHRVIEIRQDEQSVSFITKGDANNTIDVSPVIPENVVGKLVFNAPKIGWPAVFVKNALFK